MLYAHNMRFMYTQDLLIGFVSAFFQPCREDNLRSWGWPELCWDHRHIYERTLQCGDLADAKRIWFAISSHQLMPFETLFAVWSCFHPFSRFKQPSKQTSSATSVSLIEGEHSEADCQVGGHRGVGRKHEARMWNVGLGGVPGPTEDLLSVFLSSGVWVFGQIWMYLEYWWCSLLFDLFFVNFQGKTNTILLINA